MPDENPTVIMDPMVKAIIESIDEIWAHYINDYGLYNPLTGKVID